MHPLDYFINPRSVAVIGASPALHKAGGRRFRSLVAEGFAGAIYPIHPTATEILGQQVYPSILQVPGPVDLAVIIVNPTLTPAIVAECTRVNVPAITIITAGFGETGPEGKRVEEELVRTIREAGGRLIGPNCAGIFSASSHLNLLGREEIPRGPITLISQSGNMGLTFTQLARRKGLGFSKMITVGNAADIRLPEYIEYFQTDPDTEAIILYIEGFQAGEGRELCETVAASSSPKPVIVLKPGRTAAGRRSARSHTGALASEERIVDAAFRQSGIIRVETSAEAWDVAKALVMLPPLRTPSVVVLSDGGGHATIVADTAEQAGIAVPPLSEATQQKLRAILPPRSALHNPVDFAGQAEEEPEILAHTLDVCLEDPEIGGAIVAGHFGGYVKMTTAELGRREEQAATAICAVIKQHQKPVIVHTIYAGESLPALQTLARARIPLYDSLEAAGKSMALLARWSEHLTRPSLSEVCRSHPAHPVIQAVLEQVNSEGRIMLLETEAREILAAYGLPIPAYRLATSPGETVQFSNTLGYPVALKIVSPSILHKTEAGGVLLDITDPQAASAGYEKLVENAQRFSPEAKIVGVMVTPMIESGLEVVVGAIRDWQFGPVVMVGLGGVFVEVLADVAFRLAPLTSQDASIMISELQGAPLFAGVRGRDQRDREAIVDILMRIAELMQDYPQIHELDLNPLFLFAQGAAIADVRITLSTLET